MIRKFLKISAITLVILLIALFIIGFTKIVCELITNPSQF